MQPVPDIADAAVTSEIVSVGIGRELEYRYTISNPSISKIAAAYRLQAFAIDPFEEPLGNTGENKEVRSLVVARFGEPQTSLVREVPDRTSDEALKEYVLSYDGLEFLIGENEAGDRSWIMTTEITGSAHRLKYGLNIGSSMNDVVATLAPESALIRGSRMTLTTNTVQDPPGQEEWHGGTVSVIVEFESGRISKIFIVSLIAM